MRKLASVQKILEIFDVENSDFLELIQINGWRCVVKKGQFKSCSFILKKVLTKNKYYNILVTEVISMEEKKRGGFRQGAGRPEKKEAEKKKMVSIRLSMNVIKHLDENIKNKSEYIENLIKVDMTKK